MKTIRDIEYLEGVKVLVRADFNVPIKNGVVGDDFRIKAALPTIDFLSKKGAVVVLISHLESIDGVHPSLEPVAKHLEKLGHSVIFIKDFRGVHEIIETGSREKGVTQPIFLLENLRFDDGEKANDRKFAQELSSLADVYVNEAFPASHREHASIVGIPQFLPSYAGFQFEKEVLNISKAFNPAHPFVFVLGGAKFDTKLPLIEKFSKVADTIFLGGALGNDALKAKGFSVGSSKVSGGLVNISNVVNQANILVPVDATIRDRSVKNADSIGEHDSIFDIGPKTLELVAEKISQAKFILWNGPLGPYEDGYVEGTERIARIIAEATKNGAGTVESIVGGGDTVASIANLGIGDKFTFVSSGGGAMLEYLAKGTLPGIEALENSQTE